MPNALETLGTSETYTTIQAWEDALDNAHFHQGECKAEVFTNVTFSGVVYTASEYPHLTARSGAEHDGRAHEVSAAGNARIEVSGLNHVVFMNDERVEVSWLEVKGPGANDRNGILIFQAGNNQVRHNIVHNNHANNSFDFGMDIASIANVYRNLVYGFGIDGIHGFSADGGNILQNTIYKCNSLDHAAFGGIRIGDADYVITNNAAFDNLQGDLKDTTGTLDYNGTSDGTGDDEGANGIANLVTADQFVNATTTFADTDLLLKAGADLIDEGATLSVITYPEINVSIDKGATRATITGTWDIGASEFVAPLTGSVFATSSAVASLSIATQLDGLVIANSRGIAVLSVMTSLVSSVAVNSSVIASLSFTIQLNGSALSVSNVSTPPLLVTTQFAATITAASSVGGSLLATKNLVGVVTASSGTVGALAGVLGGSVVATSSTAGQLSVAQRTIGFYERTANQITSYFQGIADTNSFVVRFDNDPRTTPADDVWYLASVDFGVANQHELGTTSSFRVVGNFSIRSQDALGTGIGALLENSDTITTAFRAINLGRITFGIPRINNTGRIGDNFQVNITCPFMIDKQPVTA
ncbi:hypothetical protein LCGC14_0425640 [marine sediment metagenome]|uniref:Uncharacterized protein n=1 Tax=marine sediment metagenome TaxID=412755 RepID=A0A0F9T7N3_9ZZZZ